jgi:hypothetical protein
MFLKNVRIVLVLSDQTGRASRAVIATSLYWGGGGGIFESCFKTFDSFSVLILAIMTPEIIRGLP